MGIQLAVGLGPAWVGMSADMLASLSQRFTRSPLSRGPCLIIDRWSGLALDSTTDPHHRTRPVLWTVHGLAWQQWRLLAAGRGLVKIVSEHGAMVLTTDATAGDGSWVWLEKDRDRDDQKWRASPTRDRSAFVIETRRSQHALDATTDPKLPAGHEDHSVHEPTSPFVWGTHSEAWQQWVIVRLPLT